MNVKQTQWWSSDAFPPTIFEGLPADLSVSPAGLLVVKVSGDAVQHVIVQEFDYLDFVYSVCGSRFLLKRIVSVKPLLKFEDLDGMYCHVCGREAEYKFMVTM